MDKITIKTELWSKKCYVKKTAVHENEIKCYVEKNQKVYSDVT